MDRPHLLLLLVICLGLWIAFDLYRTLRTGLAHGRLGTITRKQERRFKRYVWSDWLMLALCAAVILWLLISPDSFRRLKAAGRKPYRMLLRLPYKRSIALG